MINHDFSKIKAIFFDWDNTLVDAWPILLRSTNETRVNFGLEEVTLAELKVLARRSTRESFPEIYPNDWRRAQKFFYDQMTLNAGLLTVFPQTAGFLRFLRTINVKTALISNKLNALLRQEVKEANLKFDAVLGSGDASADKPSPETGLMALSELKLKADEAIYLGDSVTDWDFAKNLNMPAIAIGDDAFDGALIARFATPGEAFAFLTENLKNAHHAG